MTAAVTHHQYTMISRKSAGSNSQIIVALIIGCIAGFCMAALFAVTTLYQPLPVVQIRYQQLSADVAVPDNDQFDKTHEHARENSTMAIKLYDEVRILCWIMTNPDNHKMKARYVKRLWGRRCNKLLFFSTANDTELETIVLSLEEGREHLWYKVRGAFKYVYENHFNDADWFYKADDDTYAIVENLRYMLYPYSPETPIHFGCKFKPFVKQGYMSGGSGYVLSKEALRRFVVEAMPNASLCKPEEEVNEDVEIGKCLENVNVIAGDSRDRYSRDRFLPFDPVDHLTTVHLDKTMWYWDYMFYKPNEGLDCCSDYAIAFHYIHPHRMYLFDYLIYHVRPYGVVDLIESLPERLGIGETEPPPIPIFTDENSTRSTQMETINSD